jgi:crotonobetainyl-CoA:carnitine CoA-transferase CaiB-like acyl-CoA transferase
MSQRMPDYEDLRARQARAQEADRISRDIAFATQTTPYSEWVEELESI